MNIKSDPNKQITIMAQSAMRLATDLAIAGKVEVTKDLKAVGNMAFRIMEIEIELVNRHVESYKSVQDDSRLRDIKKSFSMVKSIDDLVKLWNGLSEDEQVKYQPSYNRLQKKLG